MRKKFKLPIAVLFSCLITTGLGACNNTLPTSSEQGTSQVTEVSSSLVTSVEQTSDVVLTGTVTISNVENGSIAADVTSGKVGTLITLTVTPDEGYSVKEIKANNAVLTANDKGFYSFTLAEGENIVTGSFIQDVTLSLDTETLTLDEIGKAGTINATVAGSDEMVVWSALDETVVSLKASADGKTCTVTNLKGGSTVVTATLGSLKKMVTVNCSSYGDLRKVYKVFAEDGTEKAEVKGLYSAIDELYTGDLAGEDKLYITAADDTDTVVYAKNNSYSYNYVTKEGTYHGLDENANINEGKSNWFSSYQTALKIDTQTDYSMYQSSGGSAGSFIARPTNFSSSMFSDNYTGYSTAGDPGANIWSGWRSSLYSAAITTAEFVTWADPYNWNEMDLTFDLSSSALTPSYNAAQGTFAQIYLGSSYRMQNIYGVFFDAGTMDSCSSLEDGAKRSIFTFSDKIVQVSGLTAQKFDTERTVGTTAIGEATWDAFNKCWKFPEVSVELNVLISYTGEDANDTATNYTRNYEISGYKGLEKVSSVSYLADYGGALERSASSERSIYGISLTPDWVGHAIPDLTNGSSWTNVIQTTSNAYNIDGSDQNLQFTAGRTVNGGNQLGVYGSDCLNVTTDKNDQSVFNFAY